jgi:hypothetical protein
MNQTACTRPIAEEQAQDTKERKTRCGKQRRGRVPGQSKSTTRGKGRGTGNGLAVSRAEANMVRKEKEGSCASHHLPAHA